MRAGALATPWHGRGEPRGLEDADSSVRREGTDRTSEAAIDDDATARELERNEFTTDELDVIEMIANGYTDRAIARRLSISVVTVRRRATSFRTKVGARNRAEAIAIAAGRGWFEHPAVRRHRDDK